MAVDHLIKLGHKRIAFIEGELAFPARFGRYEGYNRQPRYEMGVGAVELMIERIEGEGNKIRRIILPAKLVVRKTCGKFLSKGD